MLKKKSHLLLKDNNGLFGKDFCEQILETVKSHKQSKAVGKHFFKEMHGAFQPFCRGFPHNQIKIQWGHILTSRKTFQRGFNNNHSAK